MPNSTSAGTWDLLGTWDGAGQVLFMNGVVSELSAKVVIARQDGNFFIARLLLSIPGNDDWFECSGSFKGHISQDKIIRAVVQPEYGDFPIAIFDGKLRGNEISGVMRYLEDMSTTHFNVKWVSDSLDPGCHN